MVHDSHPQRGGHEMQLATQQHLLAETIQCTMASSAVAAAMQTRVAVQEPAPAVGALRMASSSMPAVVAAV